MVPTTDLPTATSFQVHKLEVAHVKVAAAVHSTENAENSIACNASKGPKPTLDA